MENTESITQTKILAAAYNIFILSGYHGTTLQKIADTAGVNKSAIHYYFRSKERLYVEIVKKVLDIVTDTGIIPDQNNYKSRKLFLLIEIQTNKNLFILALKELFMHDWEKNLIRIQEWIDRSLSI